MHLETLEVSLRDFDEELCSGFSRVCEDGLADDSITRLDKNEEIGNEGSDEIALGSEFHAVKDSKGDLQRRQHRSGRLRSRLAWRISGLICGVWGLWTTALDLIGAWVSRMDLRVEGN